MSTLSIIEQLVHELDKLSPEQQEYLLDVARSLQDASLPPGTPGKTLIEHIGQFEFAPGAVDEMIRIIEEGCEKIDWDSWQ